MNPIVQALIDECTESNCTVGAFGELEHSNDVDVQKFAELCSAELNQLSAQRDASNRKIEELTDELIQLKFVHDTLLHKEYSKDTMTSLYDVWNQLPACRLLCVIGGAIQELDYYAQREKELDNKSTWPYNI